MKRNGRSPGVLEHLNADPEILAHISPESRLVLRDPYDGSVDASWSVAALVGLVRDEVTNSSNG
ncbi:hypothetical protein PSCLAVI8L_130384 [Pseudoclavibacter sp. 8L]|nr:hypothetical protein PSCLAVI8L_130384 [Pseudoclavibacter sp. 8L]